MSESNYKNKQELIQRISDVTDIRSDVVQDVLEGLVSVAMEEICSNDGHFRIPDLLTIGPEKVRGYKNKLSTVPSHKRLRPRLSTIPKIMFKIQQDQFADDPNMITAENWRQVFEHYKTLEHGSHKYTFRDAQKLSDGIVSEAQPQVSEKESAPPPVQDEKPFRAPTIRPPRRSPEDTTPQDAPEQAKPARRAPQPPPVQNSPSPKAPPATEPYNPYLDDDDDEY